MFNHILIAEDHQTIKLSVEYTLNAMDIPQADYAYYCDDALLRLKRALEQDKPFELLITDLSFEDDGRQQLLKDGIALIYAAKALQPSLKVLVLSTEGNPVVINGLFQNHDIDAFVHKSRNDAAELKQALEAIKKGKKFISPQFNQAARTKNAYDFDSFDIMILKQMVQGTPQKNIPDYLKSQGAKATSLSSIEKRLFQIREALGFQKNEQLIAYCKDRRII